MQLEVWVYTFLFALKAIVTFTRPTGRPQELQRATETFTPGKHTNSYLSPCTETIFTASALLQCKLLEYLGGIRSGLTWQRRVSRGITEDMGWIHCSMSCCCWESITIRSCVSISFVPQSDRSYISLLWVDFQTDLFQPSLPESIIVLYFLFSKLSYSHSPWHSPPSAVLLLQVS